MSDTSEVHALDHTASVLATDSLRSVAGATQLIEAAIDNGLAASEPHAVGDRGLAFVVPTDHKVETVDVRSFEDEPRLATFRSGSPKFVGVDSLARYVARYQTDDTIAYIRDVYGRGAAMLTSDTDAATVIIDDHPRHPINREPETLTIHSGHDENVGRRVHTAVLVLRPTAAARRWGSVLGKAIGQEEFLDLVDDGISEIASPDAAQLRDLISDLHAIRNSEVKSVIRTGGQGAIQISENVQLHAGTGDRFVFPERMTIVLDPFAGIPSTIHLELRIAPKVRDGHVEFKLACPTLDDKLAGVLGEVAADLVERTGLNAHWQP